MIACWDPFLRVYRGLYWENGEENGNYYLGSGYVYIYIYMGWCKDSTQKWRTKWKRNKNMKWKLRLCRGLKHSLVLRTSAPWNPLPLRLTAAASCLILNMPNVLYCSIHTYVYIYIYVYM